MAEKGRLIVFSGASGAGKSTVLRKMMEKRNDVCFSVSVTTRAPRPGEVDGKDYYFINDDQFAQMVENDELLEHATYVNHSYGTPQSYVDRMLDKGFNVVLDIEVQGARKVHEKRPDAVMVFVAPPSLEELKRRLIARGTETEEAIAGRLERARQEYAEANFCTYRVINDNADVAAEELSSIITAEHCLFQDRKNVLK